MKTYKCLLDIISTSLHVSNHDRLGFQPSRSFLFHIADRSYFRYLQFPPLISKIPVCQKIAQLYIKSELIQFDICTIILRERNYCLYSIIQVCMSLRIILQSILLASIFQNLAPPILIFTTVHTISLSLKICIF